jgi:hypothetical protein
MVMSPHALTPSAGALALNCEIIAAP